MDNPLDGLQQIASDVSSDIQQAAKCLLMLLKIWDWLD
jgi:hypothetical protein